MKRVAITGGGGYVGSALVPYLAERGYDLTVLDTFWYGRHLPAGIRLVEGDVRRPEDLAEAFRGAWAVIHLACISNDPSFELDPALGRSINRDAFPGILRAAREAGVERFIYASSSSVYGVRQEPDVSEETPCTPLTDYSRYKLECEGMLARDGVGGADWVVLRPATVCGYAPRLRLDLTVNLLTIHALVNRRIRVFGGSQLRPNLHMRDMVEVYRLLLEAPSDKIRGRTFNAGYQNLPVRQIAERVREALADLEVEIAVEPTDDLRSYHIASERIRRELGFEPRHTLEEAVEELRRAWEEGRIREPLNNPAYHNLQTMKRLRGRV